MTNVPTLFTLAQGNADPFVQLLGQVRQAVTGVYEILGEMGRTKGGNVVYLAREIANGHLVAMKLSRGRGPADRQFSLEVVKTLDDSVPGLENQCPVCKMLLADWGRFCTRCGADLSTANANPDASQTVQLVDAVRQATAGAYEILGKMDRSGSKGVVFFARDLKRHKLVALRLQRDTSGDPNNAVYSLGETQIFSPLAAELGATKVEAFKVGPPAIVDRRSQPVPAPAPPRPTPLPAPAPPVVRGKPVKAIAAAVGVALVAIIGYLVFRDSGGQQPVTPAAVAPQPAAPAPPPSVAVTDTQTVSPQPTAGKDAGTIEVAIHLPPDARITVDGRAVRGPSVSVPAGAHSMALDAAGFRTATGQVIVEAGQTVEWRPKLVIDPASGATTSHPTGRDAGGGCAGAYGKANWASAAGLCSKEAAAGNAVAQRMYGQLFEDGHGVAKDPGQAVSWYTRAAGGGDHDAQIRLGYLYRTGRGVAADEKQSAHYFRLATEGGSATAQLEYGVALETGRGIDKNEREAADWYRKSAAGGNSQAPLRLGRLYERGRGVDQNFGEAASWYRQAADRGVGDAAYALAKLYKDGKGVQKSVPQAIEWFRKAAQLGNTEAAGELRDLQGKGDR